ncbi:small ribosomal subunit biogenesis GTPase RsgA [Spirulina sp. CCNP1310]|uniref:small ribosomal subunit biogenesis GTPase RsgA n=1 Tax=Spirulina sp. CCNP1310 TaxID=3110249 RepID=UPI002B1EBAD7|nr:small ribosomal subunit biogenesis GTPase RsgA [Spirulina sp. CCNP1310]MEA5420269.1 small ribosomal subunit biogenesis GTPase RsgA [Spirulina sp. CCNP1310]
MVLSDGPWLGVVLAKEANFYRVCLEAPDTPILLCTGRSRLKKMGERVMVGDRVRVEAPDFTDGAGVIAEILPRRSLLSRPPVANAQQIILVFALTEPSLEPWQLSRFLIHAEATGMETKIVLNKCDLVSPALQQAWQERIQAWGYPSFPLSVTQNQGFAPLYETLADRITLCAGPSGVGKSSLIQRLIPDLSLRVGAVSGKLQRGRHTTRHVELFPLPDGGLLADSPGFNQPELPPDPQALPDYFPEIGDRLQKGTCQFNNCTHRDEPDCQVRGDWERYPHYVKFLGEAIARQTQQQHQPDAEAPMKVKITTAGQRSYEPRLESKKYRRTSRRLHHQTLQDWETNLEDS